MATEETNTPQSQEEMIKAAQEAAVKAAIEEAQAMFGNIPGFQMPDMGNMEEQIMAQMKAGVPGLDEIQAQQDAMGAWGDIDPTTYDLDWKIRREADSTLNAEQLRLLSFGAPLLVYNDEDVNAIDCDIDIDTIRTQLESWWDVTDDNSTMDIVEWLLNEGHHAEADKALQALHETGQIDLWEEEELESKLEDVVLIVNSMLENDYCTEDNIPHTAIAWDLVRAANLGRWAFLCGYIPEEKMWEVMKRAAEAAMQHFDSWEEYGLSFVLGRGVWHGDPDDSETAYEIVSLLLEDDESPWKQIAWV